MNTNEKTVKIQLWGIVQGVGFRPFVAKLADRLSMRGEVANVGGLVNIWLTDTPERIAVFLEAVSREKPGPAEIIHIKTEDAPFRTFEGFAIIDSGQGEEEAAMIPADLSICPHCLSELFDPGNPRYHHPFISCMECGPRYTIIDKTPYDRENTAMADFPMCDFCEKEYTDRENRRYHAQTVSCHDCGPYLIQAGEPIRSADETVARAAALVMDGKVIAVKGMGGYNLVCDPGSEEAVETLRRIKHREQKPFAVMFSDAAQIKEYCHLDETEKNLLLSSAKPILLLERRIGKDCPLEWKKSRFVGAFLPSMGFQHLLLAACQSPLIVTSANLSGLPMIKDDGEMLALSDKLAGEIAGVFYNERDIRVAVDDSVVRVIDHQPQMIRRSKGYAPVPLYIGAADAQRRKTPMMLACGGQLKNSFALSKGPFSYVSQYFGDMDSLECCKIYEDNIHRMKNFFKIEPQLVICDMHPLYETTKFAEQYAKERDLPLLKVQHHHAHVASVMAEHGLTGPVIGVSFDGTGYGSDGAIWGGEFLLCEGAAYKRAACLKPVLMLGGDSSMREAWKSAASYLHEISHGYMDSPKPGEILFDLSEYIAFRRAEKPPGFDLAQRALEERINTVESTSMGRLFDAVAAFLDIKQENSYEGECAILLEDAAARAMKNPGKDAKDDLALRFHEQVAEMILKECVTLRESEQVHKAVLTGGVFQNKILMEKSLALLRNAGFSVYYNVSVSPNDGGIALGQNYIGMLSEWKKER